MFLSECCAPADLFALQCRPTRVPLPLSDDEFNDFKRRFRAGEFPPELYDKLRQLVRAAIFGPRPISRSDAPHRVWNDQSVEDAFHGWLERRLLRGGLAAAFDRCSAARPFLNYLEEGFRSYLKNERARSETANLYRRTTELLTEDGAFREWQPGWWGLAGWSSPEPYQGSDDDIMRAAWQTGDYKLELYGPHVERLDPILKREDLKRFVVALLELVGRLLERGHIAAALKHRFNLDGVRAVPLGEIDIDDVPERPGSDVDEEAVELAAREILEELDFDDTEILFRRLRGANLAAIAEAFNVSTSKSHKDWDRIRRIVKNHESYNAPVVRIVEKLLDLLS
jgi:hypothetical protein